MISLKFNYYDHHRFTLKFCETKLWDDYSTAYSADDKFKYNIAYPQWYLTLRFNEYHLPLTQVILSLASLKPDLHEQVNESPALLQKSEQPPLFTWSQTWTKVKNIREGGNI